MNPLDHLATTLDQQEVSQTQREALIDLAVWAMYVDGRIQYEENDQIDEMVDHLSASSPVSLHAYLYTAIAKIRDVWNNPDRAARILTDIDHRLGNDEMRQAAFALCNAVTRADGELADAEKTFLDRLQRQFGLAR